MFYHSGEKNPATMQGAALAQAVSTASSDLARVLRTALVAASENTMHKENQQDKTLIAALAA